MTTRDRFVAAASDLFYEHGFHAVGLDTILDAVGVTKTTFYKHFESKDDLIVATLEERDRVETEQLAADVRARAGDDPREQILAIFDVLQEWFSGPEFRGCIFLNAAVAFPSRFDPIHRAAAAHGMTLHARLTALARAAGAHDPDTLAAQLLLLLNGAIASTHVSGEPAAVVARSIAQSLIQAQIGTHADA